MKFWKEEKPIFVKNVKAFYNKRRPNVHITINIKTGEVYVSDFFPSEPEEVEEIGKEIKKIRILLELEK